MKLNLWRKRVGAPKAGEQPLPILFLVHGSSNSTRSSYDLTRAGQGRILVHERHGALRLRRVDHGPRRLWLFRQFRQQLRHRERRRGPEGRDAGGAAGDRPEQDAYLRHVVGRHPRRAPTRRRSPSGSTGWCWSAFTYKGTGAPEIARRRARIDELRANTRRKRDAAMIRSIFTRDGHASALRSGGAGGDHRRRR